MNAPAALLAVLFLVPAVRACDPGGSSGGSNPPQGGEPGVIDEGPAVEIDCPIAATDPVEIDYAYVEDGEIVVGFWYSGGCVDQHDFALCWDGSWIKTSPMKVGLDLRHDAHGDACRMYIGEERAFDLSVVADETLTGFPNETGVWLNLGDESHWYGF